MFPEYRNVSALIRLANGLMGVKKYISHGLITSFLELLTYHAGNGCAMEERTIISVWLPGRSNYSV